MNKLLIFWGSLESLRAIMYSSQERTCQNNLFDIIEALHWVWWSPTERWTPTEKWPQFWNLLTTESFAKVLWTWQLVFFRMVCCSFHCGEWRGGAEWNWVSEISSEYHCSPSAWPTGKEVLLFLGEPLLFQNMQFLIIWSYTDSSKVGSYIRKCFRRKGQQRCAASLFTTFSSWMDVWESLFHLHSPTLWR